MRCCETGRSSYWPKPPQSTRQEAESSSQEERRPREGADDGADSVAGANPGRLRFQPSRPAPSLPHQVPNEHAENTGTRKRRHPKSLPPLDPLENGIRAHRAPGVDGWRSRISAQGRGSSLASTPWDACVSLVPVRHLVGKLGAEWRTKSHLIRSGSRRYLAFLCNVESGKLSMGTDADPLSV